MKRIVACLLSLCLFSPFAFANTFTTDLTDLWWNENESGWGVTATHQREVVFLTFFVYAADSRATFYTGQATYVSQSASGALIFSGPLYETQGPWIGVPFNPNLVTIRQAGNVTFTAFIDSATMTYNVDSTNVTKALTRQTFRNNDLTGGYAGIFRQASSGCATAANNVTVESVVGVAINNTTTTFSMTTNESGTICEYTGNYRQSGRMGSSSGGFSCPGRTGSYQMVEIEANPSGITGRFTGQNNLCSQVSGRLALVKR
ncbi:MAG: hypothetical protein LH481_05670 [Burkholderiales bacterium]|nr:hypothetical protein [Burkholderiales bacterium]